MQRKNVIFYVAGYIGRSISRANRCDKCKSHLLQHLPDNSIVEGDNIDDLESFIAIADRGGLSRP